MTKINLSDLALRLQRIAQNGIAYSKDAYDIERFKEIQEIAAQIYGHNNEIDTDYMKNLFLTEAGYQTPKVDVRSAVFKGGKILLVREKKDGKYSLPGGWAEPGHSIKENLVKESLEEAGVKVTPLRLISILNKSNWIKDNFPFEIYKVFYLCSYEGGSFKENIETTDSGFFERNALPELSVSRNTLEQVLMCFDAYENPNWEPIIE